MREIKIRYYFKDQQGNVLKTELTIEQIEGAKNNAIEQFKKNFPDCIFVARVECTGLPDKNDKEIYEGDILHHKWNSGNNIFLETISEVKFSKGAFVVDDKKRDDWLLSLHALPKWAELEIIGNIYETPDLLKQGVNA